MSTDISAMVLPVAFSGVEVFVQVSPVVAVGSEPTSVTSRVHDTYRHVEDAVLAVAASMAATIDRLPTGVRRPREMEVEFGVSVSAEGTVYVAKGSVEATVTIKLTYDVTA